VEPGAIIAQAGAPPEHAFWVQHGSAAIELPAGRGGKPKRVGIIHAGDAFGEVHLLDGRPYGATLRAAHAGGALSASARTSCGAG